MSKTFAVVVALAWVAQPAEVAAQAPETPELAPIRSSAAGIWTNAPSYRASFHGGFAFYPSSGRAGHHFGWRTESVTAGGHRLAGGDTTATRREPHRFEYHHHGAIEAYDVREDGVEQTFTIASAPAWSPGPCSGSVPAGWRSICRAST